ncbi:ribonuclease J [Chrysiogenes arsenatis]|uniref:ribonuclease J n=1 Tax=Chrysiogenes arsenatis TaxID=309797 RepID=UPI00040B7FA3|nr:ribonuclease J [Chrysiogenes arsenatis]
MRQDKKKVSKITSSENVKGVKVTPLGGLGEIGLNLTCYETRHNMIIVDCGLMFPEDTQLGVDIVIPDMSYLVANITKVQGLFITHGHEDHIGAIPFLVRHIPGLKIFGTKLVIGFITHRLKERNLENAVELICVAPGDCVSVNEFDVEFIGVNHSIADACALAISTPSGVIIHTGDFKIDHTPVDHQVIDLASFARYGDNGVLALFSDSTNVESAGCSPTERGVEAALDDEISKCKGKVVTSTFSSNIHRIQTLLNIAKRQGRKVAFDGRSIVNNALLGRELGYLTYNDEDVVSIRDVKGMAPQKLLIITTGSQGEPYAALTRIATDNHANIKIKQGDTVIFSSKTIPGNERSVSKLINQIFMRGARVVYDKMRMVHASGHAYQEELKTMINLVRPHYFIPIHGEYRHLHHHAELAKAVGIAENNVFILRNGLPLQFDQTGAKLLPEVQNGRVFIDGRGMEDVEEPLLMDRRSLASDGVVVVHVAIGQQDGAILDGPHIITCGFEIAAHIRTQLEKDVLTFLQEAPTEMKGQWNLIKLEVRKTLRQSLKKRIDRKPMVLPVIVEI